MARFNPPPGWPAFPDGWVPPEGWQPDPRWPRPPVDWQWWLTDPPRRAARPVPSSPAVAGPARLAPRPGWGTADAAASASVPTGSRSARRRSAALVAALSRPLGILGLSLAGVALVVVAGSLLPWIDPGARPVGGIPGDWLITLTFGALLAVGGGAIMVGRGRGMMIMSFAFGLGCAAVCVIDITSVASAAALGAVGPGLWITAAGAAAAVAVAVAGRRMEPH